MPRPLPIALAATRRRCRRHRRSAGCCKIGDLKALAIGAVGGLAATLAAEAIGWATGAVTSAVTDYAQQVISSGPQIEAALTAQAELVERIKGAFSDAEDAASSYGANTPALLRFEQQERLGELGSAFDRGQDDLLSGGIFRSNALQAGQGPAGSPLQQIVADFRAELAAGEADIIAFRNKIVELAETLPENDPGRRYAKAILEDTAQLAAVQAEIARGKDLLAGLSGDAEAAATALGGTAEQYAALGTGAEGALPALRETDALLRSISGAPTISRVPGTGFSTANPDPGFAGGGWTGGRRDQVMGVVHGEEFVVKAGPAARHFELLQAINAEGSVPGYASGGFVGSARPSSIRGGRSGDAGAFDIVAELTDDLSVLSGAVSQFARDLLDTRDPLQALGSVIQSVSQSFLNSALGAVGKYADTAISGVINSAIGSMFGGGPQLQLGYQAGVYHDGGRAGAPASTRFMPAALFDNAPRLHRGLAGDEFTAILQEGETVIPRGGRAVGGGGGVVNYWNIETPSPRSFMESRASLARAAGRLSGTAWRHS